MTDQSGRVSSPDEAPEVSGCDQADPTGVWWDPNYQHYGWTCPRCRWSGINHMSVRSARFEFAAHYCPPHVEAT